MKTVIHSAKDRGVLYPLTPFLYMGGLDGAEMVPGSLFVPPFYAGKLTDKEEWHLTIVGVLAATIFGGVHCIAWSFQFPSLAERVLWRMSSVAITCLPAIILRTIFALGSSPSDLIHRRLVWSAGMAGFFYVLARITLLVLALMSIRSLPAGAYQTVKWTTYIPHV